MVRIVKRRVWHRMKDARNVPKEGGYGGGGANQKLKKGIPSAAGTRPLPNIDPLVYVGGAWRSCPAFALLGPDPAFTPLKCMHFGEPVLPAS